MKTKVRINNKFRIEQGLEPIHPAETTVEFSLGELSEVERKWVAKYYDDTSDSIIRPGYGNRFLLVSGIDGKEVISVIRNYAAKEKVKQERSYAAQKNLKQNRPKPKT